MSSYELLELVEYLPEAGAYKTAVRGGRMTFDARVQIELFNEIARLRASVHAAAGGKSAAYEPFEFTDPAELAEQERAEAAHAVNRAEVETVIFRGIG